MRAAEVIHQVAFAQDTRTMTLESAPDGRAHLAPNVILQASSCNGLNNCIACILL